jgi:cardiolipin synthase (CMP-forming)
VRLTMKEVFSIPNCLSYLRILLLPVFVYIYLTATRPEDYYWAAGIILFSALTDLFDGLIARKFNQVTELGKALDPVADKLQQAAIAICLMFTYKYMWVIVLLFVIKELFMGINGLILMRRGKKLDGALWFGKVSTAVFYVAMLSLIAFPNLDGQIATIFIIITFIFLSLSFLLYIPVFIKMYRS